MGEYGADSSSGFLLLLLVAVRPSEVMIQLDSELISLLHLHARLRYDDASDLHQLQTQVRGTFALKVPHVPSNYHFH